MPNVCKICNHSKRLEIDRELVEGKSKASISRKYGVSHDSLSNHATNHLSRQLVTAYETRDMAQNMDLMNRIDRMIDSAATIFKRNFDEKKDYLALQALNSQKGIIELLAKISAYLHQSRAMELETSQREDDYEMKEAVSKLELCELELLGKIQDKLAGKIKWERLLPDDWYSEEDDYITINVKPIDKSIESERIIIKSTDDGPVAKSISSKSVIETKKHIEDALPEQESNESVHEQDKQDEPEPKTAMTRNKPFSKVYYGPSLPLAKRRQLAKQYVRDHGRMPRETWLRDAL